MPGMFLPNLIATSGRQSFSCLTMVRVLRHSHHERGAKRGKIDSFFQPRITLALSGARTLLIDSDLRRGTIRENL